MSIEEVILKRQIFFNNNWSTEKEVNTEALHLFQKRMDENKLNQLLVPIIVEENEAFSTFTKDKELAKIFSAYLDVFHFLPLHPDLAFDNIWRTLEYTIKLYAKRVWNYGADKGTVDCFKRVAAEVIEPMVNKTRVRDNILKSKEQKNIQPTKGGHKMVTCQNYVSLFYCQITSCPSDGGIS